MNLRRPAAVMLLVWVAGSAYGEELGAEDIRRIAAGTDERSAIAPAMRVFPAVRAFEIVVKSGPPGGDIHQTPNIRASEKMVTSKYLVTQMPHAEGHGEIVMVVFHDEAQHCYKKFVLLPDNTVLRSVGTREGESRTLSWIAEIDPERRVLTQEHHNEEKVTWRALYIEHGEVVFVEDGTAKPVERVQ
jgi:hypothetical protein